MVSEAPVTPRRVPLGADWPRQVPALTFESVEKACQNPEVGCLIDRVHPGQPLVVTFGFLGERELPRFDFFGRTRKLEDRRGIALNRILVRDLASAWYHREVPGLGFHVDEVAQSLRSLIAAIRPSRVITLGQSMGGYAAVLFGMLLDVERIVAFGCLSHLKPREALGQGDLRYLQWLNSLATDPPPTAYDDLAALGKSLAYRGQLHLDFGTHPGVDDPCATNHDAIHALRLACGSNVILHPYPESRHRIVEWLVAQKQMDELLERLLLDDTEKPTQARGSQLTPEQARPTVSGDGPAVPLSGPSRPVLLMFHDTGRSDRPSLEDIRPERIARLSGRAFVAIGLRDPTGSGFYRGFHELGESVEDAAAKLAALIAELEPAEILTCGEGLAGHAALVYGVLLGARRIVVWEPLAHRIEEELLRYNDHRWQEAPGRAPDSAATRRFDVPELMSRSSFTGHAFVLFGTRRESDREDVHVNSLHAHWLARSERVVLQPFPQVGAGTLPWLLDCGLAESVLARLLFDPIEDVSEGRATSSERAPGQLTRQARWDAAAVAVGIYVCDPLPCGETPQAPLRYAAAIGRDPGPEAIVDDEWRRWIAENLLLGSPPEDLVRAMAGRNITEVEARREIDHALASPYFRGARRYSCRLERAEWIVETYRKLRRLRSASRRRSDAAHLSRGPDIAAGS